MDLGGLEPAHYPDDRPRAGTVRSRLMLEAASDIVSRPDWERRQARIELRRQGPHPWDVGLLASDGPWGVGEVLSGRATFAILNPATSVRPALRRQGADLDALAAIATIPSYDQMGFAVRADLPIASLEDLAGYQPPLVVSLRAQRDHSVQMVVEDALEAAGASLERIRSLGGRVEYHEGIPHRGERLEAIRRGDVDAVFDEGIYNWTATAVGAGLRFVPLGPSSLKRLQAIGYRPATLRTERYPVLDRDVATVDFSGFLIFTRADTPDGLVATFCDALERRRASIPWQGGTELPLERMCTDEIDAPVPIPLHPSAAAYWEAQGYLA